MMSTYRSLGFLGPLVVCAAAISYACGQSSSPGNNSDAGGGADGASSGSSAASGSGSGSGGSSSGGGTGSGSGSASGSSGGSGSSSGSGGSSGGSASGGGSGSGSGGTSTDSGTVSSGASVLQHHMSPTRDGVFADPSMTTTMSDAGTKVLAKPLKLDATFAPTINGNIYAQPLYVTNGPGGNEAFIIVTELNHVMAIDGTGKTVWEHPSTSADTTNYGTPVTGVRGVLGCGNIDPLGITGTPVIDATSRTIYFDAMTMMGTAPPTHKIYGVSLDDGTIKPGWPVVVDTAVTGFVSRGHNQRGALALQNGVLYVPYGGHNGDCGTYNGWVIGVNVATPSKVTAFSTNMIAGGAARGGIWAVGGVASTVDGTSLFVSTGNTGGVTTWAGGEAVLRLDPGPTFTNQASNEFYPTEWLAEDMRDEDLGGANPVVLDLPGAPTQHLVIVPGKDGYLYLLNRDNLGGMGGQLFRLAAGPQGQGGTGALKAASAAYTTSQGTYVAYNINVDAMPASTGCPAPVMARSIGVARISGSPATAKVVWCTAESGMGSPIVTMTGNGDAVVWDANNHLYGYDGDTGVKVYSGTDTMANAMHYYNTPIDAGGRIVVATCLVGMTCPASGAGHLYVFKP